MGSEAPQQEGATTEFGYRPFNANDPYCRAARSLHALNRSARSALVASIGQFDLGENPLSKS